MASLVKGNSSFDFSCALLTHKWELWCFTVTLKPLWLYRGAPFPRSLGHCTIPCATKEASLQTCQDSSATQHACTPASGQNFQFCCSTFWRGKTQVPVQAQPITPVVLGELDTDGPEPLHPGWTALVTLQEQVGDRAKHAKACLKHSCGLRGFARFASAL